MLDIAAESELVIGIVKPLGADDVFEHIKSALESVDYGVVPILPIELALRYLPANRSDHYIDDRYEDRMKVGDTFRARIKRDDALGLAVLTEVVRLRKEVTDSNQSRRAYVVDSLKTPQEAELLRKVYQRNFVLVAAYEPRARRVDKLAAKISTSHFNSDAQRYRAKAEALINRDESGNGVEFGQNVKETFPLADFFVDVGDREEAAREVTRFVELLFGYPLHTPTKSEVSMFHAYGGALRSSAARQVGAAIVTDDGEVVSIGTNEEAKAFGGQRWSDDDEDCEHRSSTKERSNDQMIHGVLVDLLARLAKKGWLVESLGSATPRELLAKANSDNLLKAFPSAQVDERDSGSLLEPARLDQLIEYMRAVHAEMSAIMSAARRGVSVAGSTLFCTTFPCHECARHIVVAGIKKVVFIEPYPKSRAAWLYEDSIAVDVRFAMGRVPFHAYVGVAPRMYHDVFRFSKQGRASSVLDEWVRARRTIRPRLAAPLSAYEEMEVEWCALYASACIAANLEPPPEDAAKLQVIGEALAVASETARNTEGVKAAG